MFLGGLCMSLALLALFQGLGFLAWGSGGGGAGWGGVGAVALVAFAATAVESLPINGLLDDNLSVPVVAATLSAVLLLNLD
jgi:phytol kinase